MLFPDNSYGVLYQPDRIDGDGYVGVAETSVYDHLILKECGFTNEMIRETIRLSFNKFDNLYE